MCDCTPGSPVGGCAIHDGQRDAAASALRAIQGMESEIAAAYHRRRQFMAAAAAEQTSATDMTDLLRAYCEGVTSRQVEPLSVRK